MCKRIISIVFGLIIVVTFTSPGWAAPPNPNVHYNGTDVPYLDTTPSTAKGTDFGTEPVGTNVDHTFTIENTGNNSTLTLTGTPPDYVEIIGDPEFTVFAQPVTTSIPNGTTTTFTIRFTPGSQGTFSATVRIPNDSNNENPYDFAITGAGSGAPEINVLGNGVSIADGTNFPNAADDTDFGSTGVGSNVDHTFTIENTGNADLTVGTVTVSDTINFSVIQDPTSPIPGSGSTIFTVRFSPQSGGILQATVSIPNDDSDEAPYDFGIQGTGNIAAPTVTLDTPSVSNVQDTAATLNGNITSTGGQNATERGVYWSTTSVSEGSGTKVSTTGDFGTGGFTENVSSGLNPGALNYFRAFATNSAGTGYSAEQAFQTEPASQPTGLGFSSVISSSMTVSWTPQSGDGSIVVVKQGGPVDVGTFDPVDFTLHGFSSDPWNGGADLGGGNYVVYRGAGTSVDIAGLSAGTTYGVAIYAYAGSGGTNPDGINYQQDGPLTGSSPQTPAGAPSLSAPTASGWETGTSATLGATIDGNGGDSIIEYGVVWTTSGSPTTADNVEQMGTSDPGGDPYSDIVPGLTPGKSIYFAGYASNSSATGYSPDGTFYTEPDIQASGVTFSNVSYGNFTIEWTLGEVADSYDGSIVIIKKDAAVDALPVDGTAYTADSVFEAGTELGTGNYVVYSGPGTTVTVTGLWHNRTYHVAVYKYSGSGTEINYILADASNRGSQATPKAPSHREAYQIDCGQCHAAHGVFGSYVARDDDQELLCKNCHTPGGQADQKQMVKNHSGAGVTTDCGSCHEVHHADTQASPQNVLWTTDFRGPTTAENLNWIRGNPGTSEDPSYVPGAVDAEPIVFHTASNDEFARPNTAPNLNPNGLLDGLCQACHTNQFGNTNYHTNDPNGPNAPNDVTYGYTHPANISGGSQGQRCLDCHEHVNGFAPTVTETNCMASACHGGNTLSRRQIGESSPGAGDGEFGTNMNSHHVNDGTGSQIVTRWDCIACHAEGDAVTGEIDQDYHAKLGVNLRHADGTVTVYTDTNGVYASDWAALTPEARSEFCMSCHDADGATIITGRTDPDPDATTNALNPFNDGVTNAYELDGFDGTPAPHARVRPSNQPGAGSPGVVDVKSQFAVQNESHHAVLGPAYGPSATAVPGQPGPPAVPSNLANAVFGTYADGSSGWTGTLNCEDCHLTKDREGVDVKLVGHGSVNASYMLMDSSGNDTLSYYTDSTDRTHVCYRCHDPQNQSTNFDKHIGRDGDHMSDANNIYGNACLNCHGGGYPWSYETRRDGTVDFVPDGIPWGAIHGVPLNAGRHPTSGITPNVFTYGASLSYMANWTDFGVSVSCGATDNVNKLNDCTNHSGGSQSYTRSLTRDYRGGSP